MPQLAEDAFAAALGWIAAAGDGHVAGGWRKMSGEERGLIDPASERRFGSVRDASSSDVDDALGVAEDALISGDWARAIPAQRSRMLWTLAEAIERDVELLALLETLNSGMPIAAARRGAVAAAETFRYFAGWCTKIEGSTSTLSAPGEYLAYTRLEPVGVVAAIVPWNFPLMMAAWKVAPALAAGCTVVLKPSELTPLTALRLADLASACGLPPGVLNVVPGDRVVGATLVAHPGVAKITFTGSTTAGREIGAAAARAIKPVTLELGGKSPTLILEDADLEKAALAAAMAVFSNAGQVCVAGSRVLVPATKKAELLDRMSRIARKLKLGPGIEPATELGPLISRAQKSRVGDYLARGLAGNAELVAQGDHAEGKGFFHPATIISSDDRENVLWNEEVFGPVLLVRSYDSVDELLVQANDSNYGLSARIFTSNVSYAHRLAARLEVGMVWVNTPGVLDPSMPFGGYKQSGIGREHGREGLKAFLKTKSVVVAL